MNRNVLLAAFVLCLAVFGPFPALAEQPLHEKVTTDPLEQLFNAGWVQVSPGVLTRDLGHGKVETLGLGAEGLQHRLQELRKHLRHLKATYDEHPTPELKESLRAYRSEVRRMMEHLETAKSVDEIEASPKTSAGINCTINYAANVDAFPLSGSAQGVGANASSSFYSNCGQTGEVWAHAYGEGRRADNSWWTVTKTDPLAGGSAPYIGTNVRATASISLNVIKECYSYAFASMTSYDIGVVYSQGVDNRSCPGTPFDIQSVTSNYGSTLHLYGSSDCVTVTWTVAATGGTTPYSFSWYNGTTYLGAGTTYSRQFCGLNITTTRTFTATVNGSDSSSPVQTDSGSHTLTIYHHYESTGGCSVTSEDGKALPVPCA